MFTQPNYLTVHFSGETRLREVRATYQGTAVFPALGRIPVALVLDERCDDPRDECEHLVALHDGEWTSAGAVNGDEFQPELDLVRLADAI